MSKKKPQTPRGVAPTDSTADAAPDQHLSRFVVFRETVESIVVAFVLAFLFRTFEAEAFVIPTGSMSPSLQGRHKDVECAQCGYRFRTSASSEDPEDLARRAQFRSFEDAEVVGGMCPMCRYPMPYTSDLPPMARSEVAQLTDIEQVERLSSYPGDRILVNKYGFDFSEPERWDVVVFKFPGDGEMNYIKRLVGLPGETLRLYQGDVFTRTLGEDAAEFRIERKPAEKVAAMLQTVHDTNFESATLHKGGWPLRWAATTEGGWQVKAEAGERTVAQQFSVDDAADDAIAWLRYRHLVPESGLDWIAAATVARTGALGELAAQAGMTEEEAAAEFQGSIRPQLITDFNSYNARIHREELRVGAEWSTTMTKYLGFNWVGDLAVDAEVEVQAAQGELVLDLVEAGYHFRAAIDVKTGKATLAIVDGRTGEALPFTASGQTPIDGAGEYLVRFANVDDQLLLWVDGEFVEFDNAAYDPDELFAGQRRGMIPWAGALEGEDQGDLSPVGVGADGAKLLVKRLAVSRDVYYIATDDREIA
jgi:signal peptidase I